MASQSRNTCCRPARESRRSQLDIRPGLDAPAAGPRIVGTVQRLEYLLQAADAIEEGAPVPARLHDIFEAGTSFGGMRPKAAVVDGEGRHWLAKFPSLSDQGFSVPIIECAILKLAAECGLNVARGQAPARRRRSPGAPLIERFDRELFTARPDAMPLRHRAHNARRTRVALARNGLLRTSPRRRGALRPPGSVRAQQAELFARMIFNILVSNDDDHLRNHGFLARRRLGAFAALRRRCRGRRSPPSAICISISAPRDATRR